jgi:hypothetical protein
MMEAADSALERCDGFHMVRLRKHIDQLQAKETVAGLYQCNKIAAERRWIA